MLCSDHLQLLRIHGDKRGVVVVGVEREGREMDSQLLMAIGMEDAGSMGKISTLTWSEVVK